MARNAIHIALTSCPRIRTTRTGGSEGLPGPARRPIPGNDGAAHRALLTDKLVFVSPLRCTNVSQPPPLIPIPPFLCCKFDFLSSLGCLSSLPSSSAPVLALLPFNCHLTLQPLCFRLHWPLLPSMFSHKVSIWYKSALMCRATCGPLVHPQIVAADFTWH